MDVQGLKNTCNTKYAQAIEELGRGEPNTEIACHLLDAAKLLIMAKKLRVIGDVTTVYHDLTGGS